MMSHERPPQPPDSADCWLALRYLTGDLDDADWSAFEERLAHDSALQATLAETVKLATGLSQIAPLSRQLPSSVAGRQQRSPRRLVRFGPVGLAAAAVCLMAFGLLVQSPTSGPDGLASVDRSGVSMTVAAADVPAVVAMWSALAAEEITTGDPMASVEMRAQGDVAVDEIDVPSWLLLAVREETDEAASPDRRAGEPL